MKTLRQYERGDRVRFNEGPVGVVGLQAEPQKVEGCMPDGQTMWATRVWVNWPEPGGRDRRSIHWNSDLTPADEEDDDE